MDALNMRKREPWVNINTKQVNLPKNFLKIAPFKIHGCNLKNEAITFLENMFHHESSINWVTIIDEVTQNIKAK